MDFFESLEKDVKSAGAVVSEFPKKFKQSPMYALEWADSLFEAVVMVSLGKTVLKWNRAISEKDIRDAIEKQLISKASSMNKSTSVSHNHIHDMEVEFWAKLADKLNWYPHAPKAVKV